MKALAPATMPAPFGSYSHGVASGLLIVTSGQLGLAADGTIPAGVEAQAELCFSNIRAILAEAEADLSHVLRFTAFVTRREHMADYMAVRDRLVAGLATKPASTLLIVSGFTRPEFLVEVEAMALLPH
ncbi:RidA family protein [Aquamicrobium terrae]|uniref:Enamine deaminase RidA (YjgF/YER057c/UK114 family) n=1 Tax=Aquamicrobium terrae TaxID=1324945 RepID=A0ABV2N456_9HYPH